MSVLAQRVCNDPEMRTALLAPNRLTYQHHKVGALLCRTHVDLAWSKRLDEHCVISYMRCCQLPIYHVLDE